MSVNKLIDLPGTSGTLQVRLRKALNIAVLRELQGERAALPSGKGYSYGPWNNGCFLFNVGRKRTGGFVVHIPLPVELSVNAVPVYGTCIGKPLCGSTAYYVPTWCQTVGNAKQEKATSDMQWCSLCFSRPWRPRAIWKYNGGYLQWRLPQ